MRKFATAEDDENFYSVTIVEELTNFTEFNVKVIVANFKADFHLFKLGLFFAGFFTLFSLLFHLLVLILAPIDDFNDRRVSGGGNLDEVDTLVPGENLGIAARHKAKLFSVRTDYADLGVADFSINFSTASVRVRTMIIFTDGRCPFSLTLSS